MCDHIRIWLAEKYVRYARRSLQFGGILTVEEGRNMVRQLDDGERAKAGRLLGKLEEKESKMRKK